MLKANVGLSRKLSQNFNSTGFSVNLEGEIPATLDDPEAVIERIRELYSVAEEALDRQIADKQSSDAIASRDGAEQPQAKGESQSNSRPSHDPERPSSDRNGKSQSDQPATNKQVQFLQTLAKRQKLFGAKLEGFIEEIVGRPCSPYDLSKKEAGTVIDALSAETADGNGSRR
jgi:hypothetical protein